jgi:SAM-dependent methyltransferase
MTKLVELLDNKYYSGYGDNWDDRLFREKILEFLSDSHVILDIGAGAGIIKDMNFKGLAKEVIGIDPDPRVVNNPYLDIGLIGFGDNLPFEDKKFDLVIMDNVAEHLVDPKNEFTEVLRVLKPGGVFLFKTPNKFHYMPLVATLTPTSFHQYYNRKRGREAVDTFPTVYKSNCKKDINNLAEQVGFIQCKLSFIEGRPEYMRVHPLLYVMGYIYETIVNSTRYFETFRVLLIGVLTK